MSWTSAYPPSECICCPPPPAASSPLTGSRGKWPVDRCNTTTTRFRVSSLKRNVHLVFWAAWHTLRYRVCGYKRCKETVSLAGPCRNASNAVPN
jgi:hypothetical protein